MPAPVRLCVFTAFGERLGGSDNILWTFLRHLDRERVDPLVVFLGPGSFEREVAALGLRTVALPAGKLRNPAHLVANVARARRLLKRERPGLVLNWLGTAQLYAGPAATLAGMSERCVWWQLDMHQRRPAEGATARDRLAALRGRLLDQCATLVPAAAVGACSAAAAAAQARIRPHRPTFSVLPGIDEPAASPPEERAALREALALPEGVPVVGITGRLFAWKGQHLVLRALAKLRDSGREAHGLIVGGGGHRGDARYEGQLQRLVSELGLSASVTFTGQVSDATPYTELMDVMVNASSPEPFGLVVVEAMALGVPVVAVGTGGPAEIVEDGSSGLLAAGNDPDALAGPIGRLLDDAGLRARIAAGGRSRYEAFFRSERMAREMEDRLEELAR